MGRWIVFDQGAAEAVQRRSESPQIGTDEQASDILEKVLHCRAAIAVVPAAARDNVVVMRIRRMPAPPAVDAAASKLAPAGFLGLSDTIDMDEEPEPPKKWWRKVLG